MVEVRMLPATVTVVTASIDGGRGTMATVVVEGW